MIFNPRAEAGRFWKFVDRAGPCWLWRGAPGGGGYGRFRKRHGPAVYAHRHSWEMHRGPIPAGLKVLHRCDTPPCVRPEHLFLGTLKDNAQDMVAKGRARQGPVVGAQNPGAKLGEGDVLAIRASTDPHADVAVRLGVSPALVAAIRKRRLWAHLPGPVAQWRDGRKGRHGTEAGKD